MEDIALRNLKIYEHFLRDTKKAEIKLYSNRPCFIYSHPALFDAILGTITENSIEYAPKDSIIKQGIRRFKEDLNENLEIIVENKIGNSREDLGFGLKKGAGTDFVKEIVENFKGKYEEYQNPREFKEYEIIENFGKNIKRESKEIQELPTYGIRINIPMESLTWQEPQ